MIAAAIVSMACSCVGTDAQPKNRKKKRKQAEGDEFPVKHANVSPSARGHDGTSKPACARAACTMPGRHAVPGGTETRICQKIGSGSVAEEEAVLNTDVARESEDGIAPHQQDGEPKSMNGNAIDGEEATKRTIFIGNVPADTKKAALKAVFSKHGKIESIRLRSLPIDNDSRMPRTLQIKAGKVKADGGSANAYICFHDRAEATAACAENMSIFSDHHIRVDMAGSRSANSVDAHYPPARSVFVGNLALDIQEEELLDIFNKGDHAMQLEDSVEAVRVVRDSKTRIGKGIAYVLFKSRVAALAALQLNGSECKGRQMRVSRVEKSPAKLSGRGKKQGSNKAGFGSQKDKKTDEFLGQKHGKGGTRKKGKDLATAQAPVSGTAKKGNKGGPSRAVKRPAVAARKAKALLAAGKVPPASALAALKKKQKEKKQGRAPRPKE